MKEGSKWRGNMWVEKRGEVKGHVKYCKYASLEL